MQWNVKESKEKTVLDVLVGVLLPLHHHQHHQQTFFFPTELTLKELFTGPPATTADGSRRRGSGDKKGGIDRRWCVTYCKWRSIWMFIINYGNSHKIRDGATCGVLLLMDGLDCWEEEEDTPGGGAKIAVNLNLSWISFSLSNWSPIVDWASTCPLSPS